MRWIWRGWWGGVKGCKIIGHTDQDLGGGVGGVNSRTHGLGPGPGLCQ